MRFIRRKHQEVIDHDRWRFVKNASTTAVGEIVDQECAVCELTSICRWEKVSPGGTVSQCLGLCTHHENELRVSADGTDRRLYGSSGRGSFPRILTRDDVQQFLGYRYYIPAGNGWKAPSRLRFSELGEENLFRILRALDAVIRGDHFTGWVVRESFAFAVYGQDGSWSSVFQSAGSIRKTDLWSVS